MVNQVLRSREWRQKLYDKNYMIKAKEFFRVRQSEALSEFQWQRLYVCNLTALCLHWNFRLCLYLYKRYFLILRWNQGEWLSIPNNCLSLWSFNFYFFFFSEKRKWCDNNVVGETYGCFMYLDDWHIMR